MVKLFGLERGLETDENAREYVYSLFEPTSKVKHVMTNSDAGTGKTTMAVAVYVRERQEGKYKNGLIYIVVPSKRGEGLGSTPGTLEEKESKYFKPLHQALHKCGITPATYAMMGIQMTTASDWRGTNVDDCYVIVDEAQNATIEDLQLIYTRGTDTVKFVSVGSDKQCDNKVQRFGKDRLVPFQVYMIHQAKKGYTRIHKLLKNFRGEQANHSDAIQSTIRELEV